MTTYIALLRAVNLGARNKVPMAWLREALTDLGHGDVRTLLQSGNAVFTSRRRAEAALVGEIQQRISDDLGLDIAVLLRTAAQLQAVIDDNPLPEATQNPRNFHVTFLADPVPARALADIDPERFAPDQFRVGRREIYVWYPDGMSGSRLTYSMWQTKLGVTATARTWQTVTKLAALAQDT